MRKPLVPSVTTPRAQPAQDSALYTEGIGLFNQGQFWHAHESWETCWRGAAEPEATFYKGIIQAAAALVHWQRGNLRGLYRNWYKARPKLVALPPVMYQANLAQLIYDMDTLVAHPDLPPPRIHIVDEW